MFHHVSKFLEMQYDIEVCTLYGIFGMSCNISQDNILEPRYSITSVLSICRIQLSLKEKNIVFVCLSLLSTSNFSGRPLRLT